MSKTFTSYVIVATLLAVSMDVYGQNDIKNILTKAANDFAASFGTTIATGALASGVCLSRDDQTGAKDTCTAQPASEYFHIRLIGNFAVIWTYH